MSNLRQMEYQAEVANYLFKYRLGGDSSNPVVLFLHGFMGDRYEFQQAIAVLSEQFYCVAIDLPAHGETKVADEDCYYTMPFTATAIIKFLDFLHIQHCHLVGYSMGGRLALYLAIHFPQYFHRVILESASPGLTTVIQKSNRLARDRQLANELETGNFRLFLENWYQQAIFANLRSHPHFPQMLEQRLKNSPSQLARSLRHLSIGIQPSLWEHLSTNQIPLLLIVGELDLKFIKINQEMQKLSKFANLEIMEQCGHNTHFENPQLFVEKINTYLRFSG